MRQTSNKLSKHNCTTADNCVYFNLLFYMSKLVRVNSYSSKLVHVK